MLIGYIFSVFDTAVVTGADLDSLIGYSFDPGSPAFGDLCRVFGFIYGVNGEPLEDVEVTAQLEESSIRYNNTIISPYYARTATDSSGYFYLDLIPSDNLDPTGKKYTITATYAAGMILKKRVIVPVGESWLISW